MPLSFHPITLQDQEKAQEILYAFHNPSCVFSFGNSFLWRKIWNTEICIQDGLVFTKSFRDPQHVVYSFPAGNGDTLEGIRQLLHESASPLRLHSIPTEWVPIIQEKLPDVFRFSTDRGTYDYVYSQQDLALLSGKKYHGKRGHITRFIKEHPDWMYEPITKENLEECRAMSVEWCRFNDCQGNSQKREESTAVAEAFNHFAALGLKGSTIRAGGSIVAFTIGEPLNPETFVIHIEKAFSHWQGAYQLINREFAKNACDGFRYINREEDMGSEGLRKAKLSYKPVFLVEKHDAVQN